MTDSDLKIIYTDRSRQISYQECPRRRFYNNHHSGHGIVPAKIRIPLATGTYTHHGLALLVGGTPVDVAVNEATRLYWEEIRKRGIQLEPGEDAAYVADEQTALVEAMLRAYALKKLPQLLNDFEVLETEYEDQWTLAETSTYNLRMMSRCDALLLDKANLKDLYIQSFKTAAQYDRRNQAEAEHDVQGLSEMAAVEHRLHKWWSDIQIARKSNPGDVFEAWSWGKDQPSLKTFQWLESLDAPPQIAGIRMEYLLKGSRREYPEGSGTYQQFSPLLRGYVKYGPTSDQTEFGWKREYKDDMGNTRRLDYRTWKTVEMWRQDGGVKQWIDALHTGVIQPEAGDCLEQQFVTPVPYMRQEDDLRDWFEQTVAQEMNICERLETVQQMERDYGQDSSMFRSALNLYFPQHRRSCDWPSTCGYVDICYSTNVKQDPVGSGLYMIREPHHKPEKDFVDQSK